MKWVSWTILSKSSLCANNIRFSLLGKHVDGVFCACPKTNKTECPGFIAINLLVSSADNLCKQFGPRSGPSKFRPWSGFKLFQRSDCVAERIFWKCLFWKYQQTTKGHAKFPQHAKTTVNGLYQLESLTLMHFQCFLISGVSCVSCDWFQFTMLWNFECFSLSTYDQMLVLKVRKVAKIMHRYNQVPHLKPCNWKMLIRIATREDTDQIASSETVWFGSFLFVLTFFSRQLFTSVKTISFYSMILIQICDTDICILMTYLYLTEMCQLMTNF